MTIKKLHNNLKYSFPHLYNVRARAKYNNSWNHNMFTTRTSATLLTAKPILAAHKQLQYYMVNNRMAQNLCMFKETQKVSMNHLASKRTMC